MTKYKRIDDLVKAYIVECIDPASYDEDAENMTDCDKVAWLYEVFCAEFTKEIDTFGQLRALQRYLRGLPVSVNIEYRDHYIQQIYTEWGAVPDSYTIDNWFNLIANKTLQLFRKCGLEA